MAASMIGWSSTVAPIAAAETFKQEVLISIGSSWFHSGAIREKAAILPKLMQLNINKTNRTQHTRPLAVTQPNQCPGDVKSLEIPPCKAKALLLKPFCQISHGSMQKSYASGLYGIKHFLIWQACIFCNIKTTEKHFCRQLIWLEKKIHLIS